MKRDAKIERQILIAAIVSDNFLLEFKAIYQASAFALPFARLVIEWCFEYYDKYKIAPNKDIQEIYQIHLKNGLEPTQAELIEQFLSTLSDEYEAEHFNWQFTLDQAENYIRARAIEQLQESLKSSLLGGRLEEAESQIADFKRVSRLIKKGVDIVDESVIKRIFMEKDGDSLFTLIGDLGRMVGEFRRGHLFAVVASAKVGKTWMLQEIAIRALLSGCNVLFVSLEMSETELMQRFYQQLTGLPKRNDGKILLPIFDCDKNQRGLCAEHQSKSIVTDNTVMLFEEAVEHEACSKCRRGKETQKKFIPAVWHKPIERESLSEEKALKKAKELDKVLRGNKFRFFEFPSNNLTVKEFRALINNLEYYDGFVPDVIITDYADKFAADSRIEYRHQINSIWEMHKAIAQQHHCCMVTASQSNTARNKKEIKQGDFAEDIRKLNLVDKALALNQLESEKEAGMVRVKLIADRHNEFSVFNEVVVLQCLKIGKPYVDSCRAKRRKENKK